MLRIYETTYSKYCALYLQYSMFYEIVFELVKLVTNESFEIISDLNKVVLIFMAIFAIFLLIVKKQFKSFSILTLVWIISYLISINTEPKILSFAFNSIYYSICQIIIPIALLSNIKDIEAFVVSLKGYLPVAIIYSILLVLNYLRDSQYSMTFSYASIITVLLLIVYLKDSKINLIALIWLLFVNLACGSRGCFVCFAVAFIIVIMRSPLSSSKVIALSILVVLITLGIVCFDQISSILLQLFPESRTISMIGSKDIFSLSGRNRYYLAVIEEIRNSDFSFHGIYSDRVFLSNYFGDNNVISMRSRYTHNFFLEVLYQWGYVGLIIILYLIVKIIKTIHIVKSSNNEALASVFIIFFSYSFQLLFSGSYLTTTSFGLLLGSLLLINKYRKSNSVNDVN